MADLKFPCPSCQQSIVCDELWCGQEIQCPSCQAELVVPRQQAAEQPSLVPKPPTAGASKLSIGKHQPAAAPSTPAGQRFVPGAMAPIQKKGKSKNGAALKYVKAVVALAAIAAAGYFGYDWWSKKQAKAEADAVAAKAASEAANTANEAAAKPLPIVPPSWTLELDAAKIPEGQANGSLAGTNFVVDSASMTRSSTSQVLDLRQGTDPIPDRQLMIYLRLGPGETLAGKTWSISQDMKGAGVPQVLKRWKTAPNAPLQQKFFSTGYAMKLELGQTNEGTIPGKIFLALPDAEQSVVAGLFKIQPPSTEPAAQPVGVQSPTPSPVPAGADRAAFERRYGIQKK